MKKPNNILLLFAVFFFIISTAFTVRSTMLDPYDCNVCDTIDVCREAATEQVGMTDCDDSGNECDPSGFHCWKEEPDPGEG